jgi:hypothetical protein
MGLHDFDYTRRKKYPSPPGERGKKEEEIIVQP